MARFELSPPNNIIETNFRQTYRIEKNNDYRLIAILTISKIEEGHKEPTVGAVSVVINKIIGEFLWVSAITGEQPATINQPAHGKCIKDWLAGAQEAESVLIKILGRISERSPRGGFSICAVGRDWHFASFAALQHLGRDWTKADMRYCYGNVNSIFGAIAF